MLEVRRTSGGLEQQKYTKNVDLADEEIPELELENAVAEYQLKAASGDVHLKELRFLVVGDQNAGKSTFLHSLCDKDDPNSTLLSSYLPAISSSFVNARFFLDAQEEAASGTMDEPPFLDTDVARTAVLMTAENFAFFCMEAGISEVSGLVRDQRFLALEFAEFGGDHLDRLLRFSRRTSDAEFSESALEILTASCRILGEVSGVAYFVNLRTLVDEKGDFRPARLAEISERVQLLRSLNPEVRVLFVCTRCPEIFSQQFPTLSQTPPLGEVFEPEPKWAISDRLHAAFRESLRLEGCDWRVRVARHLEEESGHLDVAGVVRTVAALVENALVKK